MKELKDLEEWSESVDKPVLVLFCYTSLKFKFIFAYIQFVIIPLNWYNLEKLQRMEEYSIDLLSLDF